MTNWIALRQSYLKRDLAHQLGELAASLSRVRYAVQDTDFQPLADQSLQECTQFIQWTLQETERNTATALLQLQPLLVQWQHTLSVHWEDPALRSQVAQQAQKWSQQILELSGLLSEPAPQSISH